MMRLAPPLKIMNKLKELNKKISALDSRYLNHARKINDIFKRGINGLDVTRMHCVQEIFKLRNKDTELKELRKLQKKLRNK